MATQQKMFCKVCYDAGKKEYNSHYVRDRIGGKVVCPTLLSQQCKYCKKHGHTPTHCPALEGKYKKPEAKAQDTKRHDAKPEAKAQEAKAQEAKAQDTKAQDTKRHEAKAQEAKRDLRERARRLCSSPPPLPLRERARRLCESPPPPPSLSENFPMIGQSDGGKIVRPAPMKINVWASVVARPQAPAVQAPAVQAPKKSQAPEPKEVPNANEVVEVPNANEVVEVPNANEVVEVPNANEVDIETGYVPETYSGCWADM